MLDLNDWFHFDVNLSKELYPNNLGSLRYHIVPQLDGRTFEAFYMDVGVGAPVLDPVDCLEWPSLLDFLGNRPTLIPCYPITQQIAEKIHARLHCLGYY